MEQIFQSWEYIPLTENHVRQLHLDLLRHSDKDERHRGNYKTLPNNVVAFDADGKQIGVVFETATPSDTPQLMGELLEWVNAALETKRLHPLLVIGIFTVTFLAIRLRIANLFQYAKLYNKSSYMNSKIFFDCYCQSRFLSKIR